MTPFKMADEILRNLAAGRVLNPVTGVNPSGCPVYASLSALSDKQVAQYITLLYAL